MLERKAAAFSLSNVLPYLRDCCFVLLTFENKLSYSQKPSYNDLFLLDSLLRHGC